MLSLSENRTALINLKTTLTALEQLRKLIEYYSEEKPGPAYVKFNLPSGRTDDDDVQIDRSIMVIALKAQEQKLVDYLETLGIDATK